MSGVDHIHFVVHGRMDHYQMDRRQGGGWLRPVGLLAIPMATSAAISTQDHVGWLARPCCDGTVERREQDATRQLEVGSYWAPSHRLFHMDRRTDDGRLRRPLILLSALNPSMGDERCLSRYTYPKGARWRAYAAAVRGGCLDATCSGRSSRRCGADGHGPAVEYQRTRRDW